MCDAMPKHVQDYVSVTSFCALIMLRELKTRSKVGREGQFFFVLAHLETKKFCSCCRKKKKKNQMKTSGERRPNGRREDC